MRNNVVMLIKILTYVFDLFFVANYIKISTKNVFFKMSIHLQMIRNENQDLCCTENKVSLKS